MPSSGDRARDKCKGATDRSTERGEGKSKINRVSYKAKRGKPVISSQAKAALMKPIGLNRVMPLFVCVKSVKKRSAAQISACYLYIFADIGATLGKPKYKFSLPLDFSILLFGMNNNKHHDTKNMKQEIVKILILYRISAILSSVSLYGL
jgi:hypothetical protein